jgi:16S rRNA (cytidine1402-2'-O)-methyltransferase
MKGILYIVSTPIGNLEDITLRALHVLKSVDVIAVEDTRHSLKLLNHYGISKPLISYWKEKERTRSDKIIERLLSGQSVALISDAGTPGISDPGTVLIKRAIQETIHIVSIPGPTAFIAALSVSGLTTDEFTFIGFLPSKQTQRLNALKSLMLESRTLVFFEAPHRILRTLMDMNDTFAERHIVVAKEITKIHEEVLRGSIPEVLSTLQKATIAGEYIIIVEGRSDKKRQIDDDVLMEVAVLMKKGLGRKEAVKKTAKAYGLRTKDLYDRSLSKTP